MEIISAYGFISRTLFVVVIVVFFWSALALSKVTTKRKKSKALILPVSILFVSVVLMLSGNNIVKRQFVKLTESKSLSVYVSPYVSFDQRHFYNYIMANLYSIKGKSGSHPTTNKYVIQVCDDAISQCATIEASQDSRDANMYWVDFKPDSAFSIPIGFVKLENAYKKESMSQYNQSFKPTPKNGAA